MSFEDCLLANDVLLIPLTAIVQLLVLMIDCFNIINSVHIYHYLCKDI